MRDWKRKGGPKQDNIWGKKVCGRKNVFAAVRRGHHTVLNLRVGVDPKALVTAGKTILDSNSRILSRILSKYKYNAISYEVSSLTPLISTILIMLPDILRDSVAGTLLNRLSNGKILPFPEQLPGFVVPEKYLHTPDAAPLQTASDAGLEKSTPASADDDSSAHLPDHEDACDLESFIDPLQADIGEKPAEDPAAADPQVILVDWYGPDDAQNPKNWSSAKKVWVVAVVCFITTTMYLSSSVFVPGTEQMMEELNTSRVKVTLLLTTFLLGFAVAPAILSPLSEHPPVGRSAIYITAIALFCVLQVPTALVHTIEKMAGLRLLAGMAAAPSLAIGGATIGDTISHRHVPYAIAVWSAAAIAGPALGPFIGSLFATLVGWRWNFWFLCIVSGCSLTVFALTLPETSSSTILHRRAQRLRALTGNNHIRTAHEMHAKRTFKDLLITITWRPIDIMLSEPIVLSIDIYMAFIYTVFNSWFEAVPIVFNEFYKFAPIPGGTVYFAVVFGGLLAGACYLFIIPLINRSKNPAIEKFLLPAFFGSFFLPIGLFIFSWGASTHTHWIAPIISMAIFTYGAYFIFQSMFSYLAKGFPRYLASVYAGNALLRSVLAAVFPLFTPAMYHNLALKNFPVALGGTIWAIVSVGLIAIPFVLYFYGTRLRGRSKFAN